MGSRSSARLVSRRVFTAGLSAGFVVGAAPFHIGRAQNAALKVGVLLPRSGAQAGIGQDCQRAVDIAPDILRSLGLPPLQIMNGDTESDPQVARTQAEKLVKEGAQLLIGAFDSGQTTTIAQVAEQRRVPLVINIAAAPEITEQGYKFVFRNFPIARVVLSEAFANQKRVFEASGVTPKAVVYMHVNDTLGSAMQKGVSAIFPKHDMPYQILQTIAYDPKSLDLALEVSRAKATGAEALLVTSRLNDAIILTRELVKQRWNPIAILSMGPGWYEDQYVKTLGKLASGPINFGPSYDPQKAMELLKAAGYKGEPLNFRVTKGYYVNYEDAAQIMVEMWKKVGLKVNLEIREGASLSWKGVREGEVALINWSSGIHFADPITPLWVDWGPAGPRAYGPGKPLASWVVPEEFAALGKKLELEMDVSERKKAHQRMVDIIEDECPAAALWMEVVWYGVRKNIKWKPYSFWYMDFGPGNLSFGK
jgi:branched-chain amino acid transport system substrate-binding protein